MPKLHNAHPYRYTRGAGGKKPVHRETIELIRFKLTADGFKNFQDTFGKMSIDKMYRQLRTEQKANTLYWQNEKSANRLHEGGGNITDAIQPESKRSSGFNHGGKTDRMRTRQTGLTSKK
tara:strand:- start:101 stop:460 length:360 start_codon:yes stop_codon:yes gene_type:complete